MLSWIQSRTVRFWSLSAFLLCILAQVVDAVDLDKCKSGFGNETGETQFTYQQCVQTCGGGVGVFKWKMFSDAFSTWLLPWIALMFQLPFGATDRADNLFSVFLAIGSPALAGYSLAMTRLNSRWLSRQFQYLHFPNNADPPLALSALQHIPFRIDASGHLLPSLIVLPQNNDYWKFLAAVAKRTRQWSIPMVMNIFWVLVAFSFTIVGSLVDFQEVISVPGDVGYPIVAVWSYLLPLVIGWLYVGSQTEAGHLRDALDEAHHMAYAATATDPAPALQTPNHPQAIKYSTELIDHVNADEKKTAPIFNYARVFIWSQNTEYILGLYRHADAKAHKRQTVRRGVSWMSSGTGGTVPENRIGNEEEVLQYCMEKSKTAGDADSPETAEAAPMKPIFATGVIHRVVLATILAHVLQWGTTGASILIHIFTPPKGFGCRALTFTVYGAAGTFSFWLLLLSSVLAHMVRHQTVTHRRSGSAVFIGYIAALTRWLGKTIAVMNGIGLLIACCMQFGGLYDNCFCSSSLFGGSPNGLVKFLEPNIKGSQVYGCWIGGLAMAFALSALYAFVIYLATPME